MRKTSCPSGREVFALPVKDEQITYNHKTVVVCSFFQMEACSWDEWVGFYGTDHDGFCKMYKRMKERLTVGVLPAQKFIRCLYPDGWFMLYLRYEMTH